MLTEREQHEIAEEFPHYETRRALIPEALKIVQRRKGWVSDEDVTDVADFLGASAEEVDSIATFYNLIYRRPVGRHVILLCDSVSCWIMGYTNVRDFLSQRLGIKLGGTTDDGRFTLLPTVCLGACDRAPAMMIDDTLYGELTPEKIEQILAQYE